MDQCRVTQDLNNHLDRCEASEKTQDEIDAIVKAKSFLLSKDAEFCASALEDIVYPASFKVFPAHVKNDLARQYDEAQAKRLYSLLMDGHLMEFALIMQYRVKANTDEAISDYLETI